MSAINPAENEFACSDVKLLDSYQPTPNAYDELTGGSGRVRPRWQPVLEAFSAMGIDSRQAAQEKARRLMVENDVTFAAGFKWAPRENLSVGGVYKMGAEFDAPTFAQVTGGALGKLSDTKFHVPDVGGLGVSWRPLPVLTLNAYAVSVKYSNLTDDFISINENIRAIPNAYESKDVVEFHAGAEYFFPSKIPFALRAGWWRDPAHSITFQGPTNASQNIAAAILFPGTKDEDHYSVGVGLAWPTFQIDAAYDTSTPYKVGSISAVYRFR